MKSRVLTCWEVKISFLSGSCNCWTIAVNVYNLTSVWFMNFTLSHIFSIISAISPSSPCTNKFKIWAQHRIRSNFPPKIKFLFLQSYPLMSLNKSQYNMHYQLRQKKNLTFNASFFEYFKDCIRNNNTTTWRRDMYKIDNMLLQDPILPI